MGLFHWLAEALGESSLHNDLNYQRKLGERDMLNRLIEIVKEVRLQSKLFSIAYAISLILTVALLKYRGINSESTEGIVWMCIFQGTPYIFNVYQKNKVEIALSSLLYEIDISTDDIIAPLANAKNTIHAGIIFCIWEPLLDHDITKWADYLVDLISF